MKIYLVASSKPKLGKPPRVGQIITAKTEPAGLTISFSNQSLWPSTERLVLRTDIHTLTSVPDDVIRPYALDAGQKLGVGDTSLLILMGVAGKVGGSIISGLLDLANDGHAGKMSAGKLCGCALTYQNKHDELVSVLLCGLVGDMVTLIRQVPQERYAQDLPPPFTMDLLRKVAIDAVNKKDFDY